MDGDESYEEYRRAHSAIRDILYMYWTFVGYRGLFDDFSFENGDFDPFYYVDCRLCTDDISEDDQSLLHVGSALKLICAVMQAWAQGGYPEKESELTSEAKDALTQGRLDHIPELRDALDLVLKPGWRSKLDSRQIYQKYVLGYLRALVDDGT